MAVKLTGWMLSSAGYLLYILVVLVVLLWILFPAETVQSWLEQQLNRQYQQYDWKIGSTGLALPDGLVLTDLRVSPVQEKKPLLTVDRLSLVPMVSSLFRKQKALRCMARLLQGDIRFRILPDPDWRLFTVQGTAKGLQMKKMIFLQERLGRKLDGTAGGTFSGSGRSGGPFRLKGTLLCTGGVLRFRAPVLGLDTLPYTKIETGFTLEKGLGKFERGTLQSNLMNGSFSGTVQFGKTPATSRVQFKGALTPRSEMFAGQKHKQLAKVIRPFLKDGGLPFTISGTAGEPGIRFEGALSGALKRLKGSTKEQ